MARTLMVELEEIDVSKPAFRLYLDSLVATELRSWFPADFMVDVAIINILENSSTKELCDRVARHTQSYKNMLS